MRRCSTLVEDISQCGSFSPLRLPSPSLFQWILLAGLALLYTHHHDLTPLVAVLTIAQQQTLATALGLDFQAHGTDASWPVLLARHIVSFQAPGQTPKKRKPAPDVFERRYARFARVLPAGRAREEILANIARQFGEMRTYFAALDSSLADCASRLEYHQQARWVGVRVHALFAPVVPRILATDGDDVDDGSVAPAGGAGGYPISPAAPSSGVQCARACVLLATGRRAGPGSTQLAPLLPPGTAVRGLGRACSRGTPVVPSVSDGPWGGGPSVYPGTYASAPTPAAPAARPPPG